jgi:DNA-binding transcriptional MerR regulator
VIGVGAFARLAQVSVRTLHHYDEVGLLRPAHVDADTGYRWYTAEQLHRLNRVLALRDLGFPLAEIRDIVDDRVSLDELRGMLRLRRAESRERVAAETERLARVEARLRQIEMEDRPPEYDVVVKRVEPALVAARDGTAPSFGDPIGPLLGRLYAEVHDELARLGVGVTGPEIALYDDTGGAGTPIRVTAAVPVDDPGPFAGASGAVALRDLTGIGRAASTIHRGPMARVGDGYQALLLWTEATGERIEGLGREVYLECSGPQDTWVTELQLALAPRREA